jgi:hypothetical protein
VVKEGDEAEAAGVLEHAVQVVAADAEGRGNRVSGEWFMAVFSQMVFNDLPKTVFGLSQGLGHEGESRQDQAVEYGRVWPCVEALLAGFQDGGQWAGPDRQLSLFHGAAARPGWSDELMKSDGLIQANCQVVSGRAIGAGAP